MSHSVSFQILRFPAIAVGVIAASFALSSVASAQYCGYGGYGGYGYGVGYRGSGLSISIGSGYGGINYGYGGYGYPAYGYRPGVSLGVYPGVYSSYYRGPRYYPGVVVPYGRHYPYRSGHYGGHHGGHGHH